VTGVQTCALPISLVESEDELVGLDQSQHAEAAYQA